MNNTSYWGQAVVNGSVFNSIIVVTTLACTTVLGIYHVISGDAVVPILSTSLMYGVGTHLISQSKNKDQQ